MAKQYARLGTKASSFYSPMLRFKLLPGEVKEFPAKAMMDDTFVTALGNGHIRYADELEYKAYIEKIGAEVPAGVTVEKQDVAPLLSEIDSLKAEKEELLKNIEGLQAALAKANEDNVNAVLLANKLTRSNELLAAGKTDIYSLEEEALSKYVLDTYELEKKEVKEFNKMSFEEKREYAYQLEKNSEE